MSNGVFRNLVAAQGGAHAQGKGQRSARNQRGTAKHNQKWGCSGSTDRRKPNDVDAEDGCALALRYAAASDKRWPGSETISRASENLGHPRPGSPCPVFRGCRERGNRIGGAGFWGIPCHTREKHVQFQERGRQERGRDRTGTALRYPSDTDVHRGGRHRQDQRSSVVYSSHDGPGKVSSGPGR